MDPFALQQEARTRSARLVGLAAFAILATVAATGCVAFLACWGVWLFFGTADLMGDAAAASIVTFGRLFPGVTAACFGGSFLFISLATLLKFRSLSSGDALMASIGATRLTRAAAGADTADGPAHERLLNVCEEMAIASGLDLPSVWVLKGEHGVNALAAGTDPSAAAVCVTRGALDWLTRDELQGVVAHEFSHILNGDMRLNFRLTALVTGISAVSRLGKGMLLLLFDDDGARRRRIIFLPRGGRGKDSGGGAPLLLLLIYLLTGAALWLVGSLGTLFARLVQCAVSREREYLADAASAQFTRHPEALANALRFTYLAHMTGRSRAFGAWKGDVAHMLFASAGGTLFELHPPVRSRIRRLSPHGETEADESVRARIQAARAQRRAAARATREQLAKGVVRAKGLKAAAASLADAAIPPATVAAVRRPETAGETLIGLLRGRAPEGWTGPFTAAARRTLALRCVNALRDGVGPARRREWADAAERVIREDGAYDSFEMMVMASVRRRLLSDGRLPKIVPPRTLRPAVARVIATVASFGGDPAGGYRAAEKKLSLFGEGLPPMPAPFDEATEFLAAFDALVHLPPLAKRELLLGLQETVAQDGRVTDDEADYLAAVADAIGAYGWMQLRVPESYRNGNKWG